MQTFRETLGTRFTALAVVVLVVLGVLLVRLWSVQVLSGDAYAAMAEGNRIRELTVLAPRGRILGAGGEELVTNRGSMAVLVEASAAEDEELLLRLSTLLQMPIDEIEERVRDVRIERLRARVVKIDVSMETVSYISEHADEFPGVHVEAIPVREYPAGAVASHVLGYAGEISEEQIGETGWEGYGLGDVVGKTGVEREYESVLRGEKGFERVEVHARGTLRRVLERREPVPGNDVRLTIDPEIQVMAEQALADAMAEARSREFVNANAGAAVVLEVDTGAVVAMASAPTFDPSLFIGGISTSDWERLNSEESEYPLHNRAIMSAYPPASTFKIVTGSAGLAEGVTSPGTTYYCAGRWDEMGKQWSKYCWKRSGHGTISFMTGIEESCDTVFYEIGYEFYKRGEEELQSYSRAFGFGTELGVDLPGEIGGRVPDREWKRDFNEYYPEYRTWLPGDTVNMAIGQGDMIATPLQVASMFATLANGGTVYRPHVLDAVLDAEGRPVREAEPEALGTVPVSPENLAAMQQGLLQVIETGTGESAFRGFPIRVAGKTGTAEMAGKDDYAWFGVYAPYDDPQYAVAVIIEQGGSGGGIAGPAARTILSGLFDVPVEEVHAEDRSR
jgi:penicillin-binding protein 2